MSDNGIEIPIEAIDDFSEVFGRAEDGIEDINAAIVKLIQSEKNLATNADAKKVFESMTAAEKEAFVAAHKLEQQNKKSAFSFTEIMSAVNLAKEALAKLKQAYDFSKQGAEIEFQKTRFDRLAQSIDTTSDALLEGLQDATKGTLSQLEQMELASNLVALGLAKTGDEAIRLAAIQSGLAMNTNQLVLTLTNQTTMRFDALGLSIDGFDEKVKKLRETGLSANEAFKEAFLQQAEEQLKRVGNAADESIGSFQRLEAHLKNLKNDFQEFTGAAAEPFVEALVDAGDEITTMREKVEAYNLRMIETGGTLITSRAQYQMLVDDIDRVWREQEKASAMTDFYSQSLEDNTKIIKDNSAANQELFGLMGDFEGIADSYNEKITDLQEKEADLLAQKENLISQGYRPESEAIQDVNAKLADNAAAMQEAADIAEEATKRRVAALIEQKLTADGMTDEELTAILALNKEWGLMSEEAVTAAQKVNEAVNQYLATGNIDDFTSAIDSATDALLNLPDERKIKLDLELTVNGQPATADELFSLLAVE